jgi:hypothetical protein|tara:strand:- start:236 stop:1180 length:945 start_codon:yes stop_codon:yes gene_type:complete
MRINDKKVDTRHQRPTVEGPTALLLYFVNDGQYADPYAISGVSIFAASNNESPSSVVTSDGEIDPAVTGNVLMHFSNSAALTTDSAFDASNYNANNLASGIYKLDTGQFACVLLDNTTLPSGVFNLSGDQTILNRVSGTGKYIDAWTVQRVNGSNLDTIINDFTLTEDRFFGITEPLLFRVNTRLENNHLVLGSKVDLKFVNEFTLENANVDRSIVNLFKESLVMDPMIEIVKKNTDRNLPSRVTVSGYTDTSGYMDVTSENTAIFTFDTDALKTHAEVVAGNLGSLTGTYVARLKFTALNQTIVSDDLGFIVR